MSTAVDNVDNEIKKLIINNGSIPHSVKISRVDFADLFIKYLTEYLGVSPTGNIVHSYRGIRLDIMEQEK